MAAQPRNRGSAKCCQAEAEKACMKQKCENFQQWYIQLTANASQNVR